MRAALLSTGTELVRGELVNSNAAWLGAELSALGVEVTEHVAVGDDRADIVGALTRLRAGNDWVICTGGLGPTTDDLTAECAAHAFGTHLARSSDAYTQVEARFRAMGRPEVSASNAKQADLPVGSEVLENAYGTAPGFACRSGEHTAFFLPGPPKEMMLMFVQHLVPRARLRAKHTHLLGVLHVFGVPESTLGDLCSPLEAEFPGLLVGYRARVPVVDVKLQVTGDSEPQAQAVLQAAMARVRGLLGDKVYGENGVSLAEAVLAEFRTRGLTLSLAESCTGGRAAALLTAIPGCSDVFLGGVVSYANAVKSSLLGVPEAMLREHGAVSEHVAGAMAAGVRAATGSRVAVAITGVAGPDGGTDEKPVGTVCFGISAEGAPTHALTRTFPFRKREWVQDASSHVALLLARKSAKALTEPAGQPGRGSEP